MSEIKTPFIFQQAQVKLLRKPKLHKDPYIYFSSEIWDIISKIDLAKNALKELDRRNKGLNTFEVLPYHNLQISQESIEAARKIARQGGPDLTDLRGYPETSYLTMASDGNQSGCPSRQATPTTSGRETKTTGPYDEMFEQMLENGGIHRLAYINPVTGRRNSPANLAELQQRANQPRRSSSLTDDHYWAFVEALNTARRQREAVALVVPLLDDQFRVSNQGFRDTNFSNFAPLISEGLESSALVKGIPDRCYRTPSERLNESIRTELSSHVVPAKDPTQLVAPNYFLELKGLGGHVEVAERQVLYYGALGERAHIALRPWGHPEPVLDGLAHTISCTFVSGSLQFYSIHAARSPPPERLVDYFIHPIDDLTMDSSNQKFKNGVFAYLNLQEFAEEMREESIRLANARDN